MKKNKIKDKKKKKPITLLSFIVFFKIYIFYMWEFSGVSPQKHQRRLSDPVTDGCWELNSGPLDEQPVLLTTEPRLQPMTLTSYMQS